MRAGATGRLKAEGPQDVEACLRQDVVDGVVWGADTRVTAVRATKGVWIDARTRRVLQAAVRLVRAGGPDGGGSRGPARDLPRESWVSVLRADRGSGRAHLGVALGVVGAGRRGDARGRRVGRPACRGPDQAAAERHRRGRPVVLAGGRGTLMPEGRRVPGLGPGARRPS